MRFVVTEVKTLKNHWCFGQSSFAAVWINDLFSFFIVSDDIYAFILSHNISIYCILTVVENFDN